MGFMDTKNNLDHFAASNAVAPAHFSAAADLNTETSLLFHDLKSSIASTASSNVMFGSLRRAVMSFSILDAESGAKSFLTLRADRTHDALSLFLDKYSSLYLDRSADVSNRANSDLMTSADFGGNDAMCLSMASLKRMICS